MMLADSMSTQDIDLLIELVEKMDTKLSCTLEPSLHTEKENESPGCTKVIFELKRV